MAENMGLPEQERYTSGGKNVKKFCNGDQSALADDRYVENNLERQEGTQTTNALSDTPRNTFHQLHKSFRTPQIGAPAKPFGPSRPFSIPPARKGGRKGPLSVEELKRRRESRKQGVCIRCRRLKSKV
jgi:hypothetical protein